MMPQDSATGLEYVDDHSHDRTTLLQDKTCVVTGSSRGIGQSIATELARHNANVVVHCNSAPAKAKEVVEAIEADGGSVEMAQANIANREAVTEMADQIRDTFGSIDVLVNNAGITIDNKFEKLSLDEWEEVISVNLTGAFICTKSFFTDLKHAPNGRIINISSVVGQQGNYGQANYAASKSGLIGFTKSLAREFARFGTTVNCVAPGFTLTEMVQGIPEQAKTQIEDQIPLRRFAEVDEIAPVVRFLASDSSSYITGEVINVNGGMYA